MHQRRIACFLLGLWLGCGLLVVWITSGATRPAASHRESDATFAVVRKAIGEEQVQLLSDHLFHEHARALVMSWESAQIVLGAGFFFFLLFASTEGKMSLLVALLMFGIVLVQRFLLTPELIPMGWVRQPPSIVGAGTATPSNSTAAIYTLLEVTKWGLGFGLAAKLIYWHSNRTSQGTAAV